MSFRYLLSAVLLTLCARAELRLPSIFGDHMVLQQGSVIPVWGWADAGEKITVTFAGRSASAVTDKSGKWRVDLEPVTARREGPAAGEKLSIAGKSRTIVLDDVLVGEVWLASGQSNMEFGIQSDSRASETIPQAQDDQIRFFFVPWATSLTPRSDLGSPRGDSTLDGRWVVCSPKTLETRWAWHGFSAIGYYFARELRRSTGVPVGVIGSYKGGTPAEAWTSLEGLKSDPSFASAVSEQGRLESAFKEASASYPAKKTDFDREMRKWNDEVAPAFRAAEAAWRAEGSKGGRPQPSRPQPKSPTPPDGGFGTPGNLFNAMIHPLVPFGIRGVIWYQGESNADNREEARNYTKLFPLMIRDWRSHWARGDFPFLYVQLANFQAPAKTPSEGHWAWVRDAQLKTLALPATGMASAVDVGDANDIHPTNKYDVGRRLGLVARSLVYRENLVSSGPLYKSAKPEGQSIRIVFDSVGEGLVAGRNAAPGTALAGFGIAGRDGKFVWAKAVIEGNTVRVSSDQVRDPVAVRYGWANNPIGNLYNREGLPASPFRTDDWVE